jgi:small subunit ribosomal protein S15
MYPVLVEGLSPRLGPGESSMLDKKAKQRIIEKFKVHKTDTGSSQVQIAILTEEIRQLSNHLKNHKNDHSSRRGLLKKVSERRRLLKYLQKEDAKAFDELAKTLKLRIAKKMTDDEAARQRLEDEIIAKQELKAEQAEAAEEKLAEDDHKNKEDE